MIFTVELTLIAMSGGIVIGTLLALMRLSGRSVPVDPPPRLREPAALDPAGDGDPLVLLPGALHRRLDHARRRRSRSARSLSAIITFTVFEAAYYSEIMRAGIQSVPQGPGLAGYAVGMTYCADA